MANETENRLNQPVTVLLTASELALLMEMAQRLDRSMAWILREAWRAWAADQSLIDKKAGKTV